MPEARKPAAVSSKEGVSELIGRLTRTPQIGDYGINAAKTVMALRLLALCNNSGHDPLVELSKRLGGVLPAKSMLALLDRCGACWPDSMRVHRPCCRTLTPDETVVAGMAQAASDGDLRAFEAVLDGFIRPDRREGLFIEAMTAMNTL